MCYLRTTVLSCLLVGLLVSLPACDGTETVSELDRTIEADPSAVLSMAELKDENRAPLEVVSFVSASGIGDAILQMALDAEEGQQQDAEATEAPTAHPEQTQFVQIKRHVLRVRNISDCEVTAFTARLHYVDEQGNEVPHEEATKQTRYGGGFGETIPSGATVELELELLVPQGTSPQLSFQQILYKENGLGGIWTAEEQ